MLRHALVPMLVVTAAAQAPAPQIQNGRVEQRAASAIDREIAAVGRGADPVWVGWRVPIVDGQRGGCCTYTDDSVNIRGCAIDPRGDLDRNVPQLTPATGPVALEAGTGLLVLARVVDSHVE